MRINIADPLGCYPLGCNAYANVLIHKSLECKDVKLRALLAMNCCMLSFRGIVVDISKGAPRAPAYDLCSGYQYVNEVNGC
jgi:hypothetical protein